MNRPNWKEMFPKKRYYIKDKYVQELEKYCDEAEMKADSFLITIFKLDKEIERLNKALDKACEKLAFASNEHIIEELGSFTLGEINRTKEEWKEELMKDE